jgi:hypothetical protein
MKLTLYQPFDALSYSVPRRCISPRLASAQAHSAIGDPGLGA